MKRDPRKRNVKAIRAGQAVFDPPEAATCLPTRAGKPSIVTSAGFRYVKATFVTMGIMFQWGYPEIGFGAVYLSPGKGGKWEADTEGMGPDFCSKMLEAWIRGIVTPRDTRGRARATGFGR